MDSHRGQWNTDLMINTTEKELWSHLSMDGHVLKAVFCLWRGNSNGLREKTYNTSKAVKDRTKILMVVLVHNSNRHEGKKYEAVKYTGISLMEGIRRSTRGYTRKQKSQSNLLYYETLSNNIFCSVSVKFMKSEAMWTTKWAAIGLADTDTWQCGV